MVASLTSVRVLDGLDVIAQHTRSYGKAEQIEDPIHIKTLIEYKYRARQHTGHNRLAHAAPSSVELLKLAVERGNRPGTVVTLLLDLLDSYGASELETAITEALQRQVPHPDAVRQALERRREERNQPPPIAIPLPDNTKAKNAVVRPAPLASYDQLKTIGTDRFDKDDNPENNDDKHR